MNASNTLKMYYLCVEYYAMHNHIMKKLCLFLFSLTIIAICAYSNNLRQINNRDGLSNSSVSCLYQDSERFLWIGTYDGLNMYDSRDIYVYKPAINNTQSLSSNVIRGILETDHAYLWITTKWGLNKFSKRTKKVETCYEDFGENSYMAKDSYDNLYILGKPGLLSLYSKSKGAFIDLPIHQDIDLNSASSMLIDSLNTIWINHRGILERYAVNGVETEHPEIKRQPDFVHGCLVSYVFYCDKQIVFIDEAGKMYCITVQGVKYVKDLHDLINTHGEIGDIIYDGQDFLIAFKTNGLIRLNAAHEYEIEKIDINCGIFSLCKDEQQNIIWIGTDGQGVYALTKDKYTFHNIPLSELPISKKRPVRAICVDHEQTLWLGTKDNGIIRIKDYDHAKVYDSSNTEHYTTQHGLTNNAVFALAVSQYYPILWIGSDGPGLNYYSYSDKKIHTLVNHTLSGVAKVHALAETNDSLLWVGSGRTLLRISIANRHGMMLAQNIQPVHFRIPNRQQYNQIYAIYAENDSILWIGMRGNGLIRFNTQTQNYQFMSFDKYDVAPMNDILCILQDPAHKIWVGSSYGLTLLEKKPGSALYDYINYNENDGLPNNTIHGITYGQHGELWMSSNTGLILFDTKKQMFRNFNHHTGLKTIEFCDNAYYQDNQNFRYFFGGVDGIVWIERGEQKLNDFIPQIYFTSLRIFNKEYNLSELETCGEESPSIILDYDQNFFSISFVATDFIDGENSRYSYKLENFSDVWIETQSNQAQFTNIPPGDYILKVRYHTSNFYNENPVQSIHIIIRPPWYLSNVAYVVYLLLCIGMVVSVVVYMHRKYERRKASITRKLNAKYKEEMYESKLRFFTNITHEFCTPLTLIYGPCERILQHDKSDAFIRRYIQIIKYNAERLNSLIQEIIDFRRMETGHKMCHIQALDISHLSYEIIASFSELAEQNHINLKIDIAPDITWNSDRNGFIKILNNLISNAFKYTPTGGLIHITIRIETDKLSINVYNTGKGISKENIPSIFNRYSVLDNIKENSIKGLSSRNGLGLAICQSIVELLKGSIQVESEVNEYAKFIILLPNLSIDEKESTDGPEITPVSIGSSTAHVSGLAYSAKGNSQGKKVLIIDDNKELLWMLKDILDEEYIVSTAENGEDGLNQLKQNAPDLIITDIMMPEVDGITLIKRLKRNKHTMHIPLVILSAKNDTKEKIEGIESGADAYISKPFEISYLKSVIHQLFKKHEELKQYYNSSASAFGFTEGKLLPNEDKYFIEQALSLVEKNLNDVEFGPEELAEEMRISSRSLYRKFKDLNLSSPKDFIREQRISQAIKLLITTNLTIQEIMYRTGFNNRSVFYQEFAKRYHQTPKEYREAHKKRDNLSVE